MPHYLVEVREPAAPERLIRTRPTLWTHETPADTSYEVGRVFQVEGRKEEEEPPFDQRLVCVPIPGSPEGLKNHQIRCRDDDQGVRTSGVRQESLGAR